jgi:mono/diheme cytochrome c family protein
MPRKATQQLMAGFTVMLALGLVAGCDSGPTAVPSAATAESTALDGDAPDAPQSGDAAAGSSLYGGTCASCHGPDATGIDGLGKNLHANAFVDERTDDEVLQFLLQGRPASDPLNTTGVDMPPKGGNPSLDETDLRDVIAYLRTLN